MPEASEVFSSFSRLSIVAWARAWWLKGEVWANGGVSTDHVFCHFPYPNVTTVLFQTETFVTTHVGSRADPTCGHLWVVAYCAP